MPYVVRCGDPLITRHFRDAARVLRPGGHFVILNYSYGGNPSRDDDEVSGRARAVGFEIRVLGETPFASWDGRAYVLRRPSLRAPHERSMTTALDHDRA